MNATDRQAGQRCHGLSGRWASEGRQGQTDAATLFSVFFFVFLLVFFLAGAIPAGAVSVEPGESSPTEPKNVTGSLNRFPDPVFILGETLPPAFLGKEIRSLRLFRFVDKDFEPIRFQVDERTEQGDWIFPYGKRNNGPQSNGRLDKQDVILFMARDAGEKAQGSIGFQGAGPVTGIELEDPVDQGNGWVYLASYPGEAPSLSDLPDYVRYDAENEIVSSAFTRAEYLITGKGLHTSFYKHHSTPIGAGGTGENLVDRLKFRVNLRFFFNLLPLSLHEEMLGSDVIAYIRGPIRVLRRYEQFVKLPFGIRGVKTYADVELYESFATVPITLNVPRGFHRVVSSATLRYGTDYSPNVIGSFFRNSELPEPLIIDGRMSEMEKHFPAKQDQWRIFYGPHGVLMTRTLYPPEILDMVEIRQGYMDDIETVLPVERFPGSIGYAFTEIHTSKVRAGSYRIFLDFYFPPHYEPGDEIRFLQLRDHPLRIRIKDNETVNPQSLYGKVGKNF